MYYKVNYIVGETQVDMLYDSSRNPKSDIYTNTGTDGNCTLWRYTNDDGFVCIFKIGKESIVQSFTIIGSGFDLYSEKLICTYLRFWQSGYIDKHCKIIGDEACSNCIKLLHQRIRTVHKRMEIFPSHHVRYG